MEYYFSGDSACHESGLLNWLRNPERDGGQLPSAKFGANAAWFRVACIAYNILLAVKHAWPDDTLHNAKAKRVRFVLIHVTGRFSGEGRKIMLHLYRVGPK